MFTIFGDLAQGIHAYRRIKSWEQVKQDVFPNLDCNYLTLEQSYRTTIEIIYHPFYLALVQILPFYHLNLSSLRKYHFPGALQHCLHLMPM
ncbi:MAG TPA: hypothetical protein VFC84_05775 [Desulfosporosinus sp.]|nr:hypothetical protein [Desulfosporosinus sp.]